LKSKEEFEKAWKLVGGKLKTIIYRPYKDKEFVNFDSADNYLVDGDSVTIYLGNEYRNQFSLEGIMGVH
jgi:hypothetical protein